MDFSDIQEKYLSVLKQYAVPIGLAVLGLVFLGYGVFASLSSKDSGSDILPSEAQAEVVDIGSKKKQIAVDVEGAVLNPGVYMLAKDARIQDALIEAGGMSDTADRARVAKGLNLAAKLIDGSKIYIPFVGESSTDAGAGVAATSGSEDSTNILGDTTGTININSASTVELEALPGIGAVTASKIISNRPYEKIEDLVTKKAVGQSVFTKIKDKISVY